MTPAVSSLPCVLFVSINGVGMGHLSRCLAYARRLQGRARPVFLSMASAIEVIHEFGFEADYFVSNTSSSSHDTAWNRELAIRLGLMFEELQPEVLVFDGTWPFRGLFSTCQRWGVRRKVWSKRGLHRERAIDVPVEETEFDLVIEPGEIDATPTTLRHERPGRKVVVPPVAVLDDHELLNRVEARTALGLPVEGRYALFSLGAGNLNDIGEITGELIAALQRRGYAAAWVRSPISAQDVALPPEVIPLAVYPLVRYMRAFDVFIGAAGYNTCCEVLQARVPSLLVPNVRAIDDQDHRARLVAQYSPAVVSPCETRRDRALAVSSLLSLVAERGVPLASSALNGAQCAAEEILALTEHATAA